MSTPSKRARRQGRDSKGKFTSGKASVRQRLHNRVSRNRRDTVAARRFEERDRAEARSDPRRRKRVARPKMRRKR